MTPEQFAYWLNGFVELNPNVQPTPEQWKMIQEHLKTVFYKVTPELTKPYDPLKPIMPQYPYTPLPYSPTNPTVICCTREDYDLLRWMPEAKIC